MDKEKHPDYPATLDECREAAKENASGYSIQFWSFESPPLLTPEGNPDWDYINNSLPVVTVNEAIYLIVHFGVGWTFGQRYERVTRLVDALQATGELPPDTRQYIKKHMIPELSKRARIGTPEQWRPARSTERISVDILRYMELLAAANIMRGSASFKTPRKRSEVIRYMREETSKGSPLYSACCGPSAPSTDTALGNAVRRGGTYLGFATGKRCPLQNPEHLEISDVPYRKK